MDKQITYIMTGEVKTGNKNTILRSGAIGSCVVIAAYNRSMQVVGMAHIMLPGKAPESKVPQKTRYADDAIDELINLLTLNGTDKNDIEVCLAGGANILERKDNDIGQDIIASVKKLLKERGIKIIAESLGGIMRRGVSLNGETGYVYFTIGDEAEKLLWKFSD
jgi:chemotaxis protein CheD